MGMKRAIQAVVAALRTGNFLHEARDAQAEKNLLAVGEVDSEFVAKLILRTRGADYATSPHHWDRSVTVHTFRPTSDRERWYIKAYFIDEPDGPAMFISVHRSER